jgi:hypothetical protein
VQVEHAVMGAGFGIGGGQGDDFTGGAEAAIAQDEGFCFGWWCIGWWCIGWWRIGWWYFGWWYFGWWYFGWWCVGWWQQVCHWSLV